MQVIPPAAAQAYRNGSHSQGAAMSFPAFFAQAPVVHTFDPLAQLLGAAGDGHLDYTYADAVRLAGHSCPTVAGAFLMGRAALLALYPGTRAERGQIEVTMPAPADHGTTGVIAQVLTLLTGAAAENGFQGIAGRHARNRLLTFARRPQPDAIVLRRQDTGATVAVELDTAPVPGNPHQRELLAAVLQGSATDVQRQAFADGWQERVRRLLLEFADDPRVVRVTRLAG
jgi:hypothetical protein